ncbi:MAG: acylphosphatase [Anaerolineae bacterium]|nr:acylphosphatase [Anaerolineae bacterium]
MTEDKPQEAVSIVVYGIVQGVGFRYYTVNNAMRLGVAGWVRNQYDGTVEIWAEGPRERLEQLIVAVRRGPSYSRVDRLDTQWQLSTGEFSSFHARD